MEKSSERANKSGRSCIEKICGCVNGDLYEVKCKGIYKATMPGFYGIQFEALMQEVCLDFGRRLIKSWDEGADKDEVVDFVRDAVDAFFKKSKGVEVRIEAEKIESPKKKAKKPRVSKKKSEPEPEPEMGSPSGLTYTDDEKKPRVSKKNVKGGDKKPIVSDVKVEVGKTKKPKCEAITAKGAPCSKCAVDGEVFCSVHLKKSTETKKKSSASSETTKTSKSKKAPSPPKHTHGLTSPPLDTKACDLCDTHGMPFEIPEYEDDTKSNDEDPDFKLTEEDFDESDFEDLD